MFIRKTKTLDDGIRRDGPPDDPVQMLLRMPARTPYSLPEMFWHGRREERKRIQVGAHPDSNFLIDGDDYVSSDHCILHYDEGRLYVQCVGAKNRTVVNLAPIKPNAGWVELLSGATLTLGQTTFLVCGRAGEDQEIVVIPPLRTLVNRAASLFGSGRGASERIGVPRSTFARWLDKGR